MKEFEDIIADVGGSGRYQKRLLYIVLGPLFLLLPLSWLNEIFLLHEPDHFCRHPMVQHELSGVGVDSNSSRLEEWKRCFLPDETGSDGQPSLSKCQVYVPTSHYSDLDSFWLDNHWDGTLCPKDMLNSSTVNVTQCRLGWHFDQTDFSRTAVSDNEWVCDNAHIVPDLYTYGTVGAILGTLLFSDFSDRYGRKPVMWWSLGLAIVTMAVKTYLSHVYWAYVLLKLIAGGCFCAIYQVPFTIITEIASVDYRSWSVGITFVTWTVGLCALPLIGWLSGDWIVISLVTVLPLLIIYVGYCYVPESPRWLLTKGRTHEAAVILRDMAKVNGLPEPKDLESRMDVVVAKMQAEKSHGYVSLFARKHIALKTLFITTAWTGSNFVYYQLMLNVGNMGGNTFLNFFLLSVIEGPADFLGMYIVERFGRRWSHASMLMFNTACLFFNAIVSNMSGMSVVVTIACVLAKFGCTVTFLIVYVQSVEIFPTCIRNTGMGFGNIVAMVIGVCGPYVVYLGETDIRLPYVVMGLISLAAALSASMLPETMGQALPETLLEANKFGSDHKYFSWNVKIKSNLISVNDDKRHEHGS